MATNWPTSRDTFTNPSSGDTLDSPSHAAQHANVNDAVEAMQLYAGLVLVKSQAIGTSVASVTVTNAFSATFKNYRVVLDVRSGSTGAGMTFTFGSTATGYYWADLTIAVTGTISSSGGANDTSSPFSVLRAEGTSAIMDVMQPFEDRRTSWKVVGDDKRTSSASPFRQTHGFLANTTSYTDFTISGAGATMTNGTIRVYGYNDG